jgi:hypothetical protein
MNILSSRGEKMPRGKELEQLPMSNIAPGAGKDASKTNREVLGGITQQTQPQPSEIEKENEDMI